MLKNIRAKSGCVIFFPTRDKNDVNKPRIIFGHLKTRPRWREEWMQLLIDLVDINVRLEGDNAFNLGDDLRCEVIAKLQAQIDEANYESSLSKVAASFLCSTTTNLEEKLTESFFKPKLEIKLRSVTQEIARSADYLALLEEPAHHTKLSKNFEDKLNATLQECGFRVLSQSIRFNPINPGTVGRHPDIATKWMEWELAQNRLKAEKEHKEMELNKDNAQRTYTLQAQISRINREYEISEHQAKNEHGKTLQQYEIDLVDVNK